MANAKYEATLWLNAAWIARLGDGLPRLTRVRLAAMKDRPKAERLRALAIRAAAAELPAKRREAMFDEIVSAMPRRLRRALGDRGYSQAGGRMDVPLASAKRSRNVAAARARVDGPGLSNPHGYES